MNNREAIAKAFLEFNNKHVEILFAEDYFKAGYEAALASQPQQPTAYRVIASANGKVVRDSLEFTRMSEIDEKVVRKSYDLEIIPLYAPEIFSRSSLAQFDLDQSKEYNVGRKDGRVIGYEVGYRHATEKSQAQQPTDLSKQLREYAADSGYSHNDYADTMLAAASEIERCAARVAPSQAQQTESQWISVEERLPENRNDVLCFVVSNDGDTLIKSSSLNPAMTGFYVEFDEDGFEPIERITHWMLLPPAPEGGDNGTR